MKEGLNEIIPSVCMSGHFTVFTYKRGKNWDDKMYMCVWPFYMIERCIVVLLNGFFFVFSMDMDYLIILVPYTYKQYTYI